MKASEFITEATSDWILQLDYDPDLMIVTMHTMNGAHYDFYDVPKHVFDVWDSVPSAGTFYHRYMKGNYEVSAAA